jgi:hypothetical protein
MSGKRPVRRGKAAAAAAAAPADDDAEQPQQPQQPQQPHQPEQPAPHGAAAQSAATEAGASLADLGHSAFEQEHHQQPLGGGEAAESSDQAHEAAPRSRPSRLLRGLGQGLARGARAASARLAPLLPALLLAWLLAGSIAAHRAGAGAGARISQLQGQLAAASARLAGLERSLQQVPGLAAAVQSLEALEARVQLLQQWRGEAARALEGAARAAASQDSQLAVIRGELDGLALALDSAAAAAPAPAAPPPPPPPAALAPALPFWQGAQLADGVAAHSALAPSGLPLMLRALRLLWRLTQGPSQPFQHPLADALLVRAHSARPGACLPLEQTPAGTFVDLRLLPGGQPPAAITLHMPPLLLDTGGLPSRIELLTYNASGTSASASKTGGGMRRQGSYSPAPGASQATFRLLGEPAPADRLRIRVLSNQRDRRYTCLYPVAVHGSTLG